MKTKPLIITGALVVAVAIGAGVLYVYWDRAVPLAGMAINYVRSWTAPPGTTTTEIAANSTADTAVVSSAAVALPLPQALVGDWPGYNRTLTSERYSQLSQINTKNVASCRFSVFMTRSNTRASKPVRSW
jgi:alcohol dehydrogenase (cytochrome c)